MKQEIKTLIKQKEIESTIKPNMTTQEESEKQKLIKRLKKRSDEIDKYIANGGKLYTRKDLGV